MERYFVELQLFMCCSLSAVEPAPDDCGQDILRQAHLRELQDDEEEREHSRWKGKDENGPDLEILILV